MLNENKSLFLNKIIKISQECSLIFDIPSSFIIANCINESGWGTSKLSLYNNITGLKYNSLTSIVKIINFGKVILEACDGLGNYCKFNSYDECIFWTIFYITHRRWTTGTLTYKDALNNRYNVNEFCQKLGNIYAPNAFAVHGKTKGDMLMELIERYNLHEYDSKKFILR